MTTTEFFQDIENQKEKAYGNAYFLLVNAVETQVAPDKVLVDIAKYIIDRRDGKPMQKSELSGKNGTPIKLEWQ